MPATPSTPTTSGSRKATAKRKYCSRSTNPPAPKKSIERSGNIAPLESTEDPVLLCALSFSLCGSFAHTYSLCPRIAKPQAGRLPKDEAAENVNPMIHTPMCHNFNKSVCMFPNCKFIHACSYCGDGHPKSVCPRRMHFSKKEKIKPSTPVNVPELDKALRKHPNHCFVHYLIPGLIQGFLAGLTLLPNTLFICNNQLLKSLK